MGGLVGAGVEAVGGGRGMTLGDWEEGEGRI